MQQCSVSLCIRRHPVLLKSVEEKHCFDMISLKEDGGVEQMGWDGGRGRATVGQGGMVGGAGQQWGGVGWWEGQGNSGAGWDGGRGRATVGRGGFTNQTQASCHTSPAPKWWAHLITPPH